MTTASPQPATFGPDAEKALALHEGAAAAWVTARSAADVAAARDLSRAAAAAGFVGLDWLADLDAACIDAEAEHAIDLHTSAASSLRSARALSMAI